MHRWTLTQLNWASKSWNIEWNLVANFELVFANISVWKKHYTVEALVYFPVWSIPKLLLSKNGCLSKLDMFYRNVCFNWKINSNIQAIQDISVIVHYDFDWINRLFVFCGKYTTRWQNIQSLNSRMKSWP